MKLLFICNANLQRSPTAEKIFKDKYETRSAGLHPLAETIVTKSSLEWADKVIVMEPWMKEEIKSMFPGIDKEIISLDIPDTYDYMDEELVKLLKKKLSKYL